MTEFTLHCFAESRQRLQGGADAELCGADWAPHRVAFFTGRHAPEFRELNEMGEVPVLVDHTRRHDDVVLSQSGDPLLPRASIDRFMPGIGRRTREVLRWMLWDNHKLTSYSATYRFMSMFPAKSAIR
jgi:glutathione S-transferase